MAWSVRIVDDPRWLEPAHQIDECASDAPETDHRNFTAGESLNISMQVHLLVNAVRALTHFVAIVVDISCAVEQKCCAHFCRSARHRIGCVRNRDSFEQWSSKARFHFSTEMRDQAQLRA